MADAAARREARRRRILENGDSRLQRITGQIGTESSPEEAPKRLDKPETSSNTLNGGPSVIDSWKVTSDLPDDLPSTSSENFFSATQSNLPRRRNLGSVPNGEAQGHDHDERFAQEQPNVYFGYPEVNKNPQETESEKNSSLISFLHSRWVYLVLAAVVNVMIVLKVEYLFGTSILVPFLLILTSRLIFCPSLQDSQSGSMLFAALILCNIRPEVIHRLKSISGFTLKLLREFSFYLFNFILIYYFFTSYWQNFDELIPNKAEVIVDRQTEL